MSFADTQPAPIDTDDGDAGWSSFQLRDPRQRVEALRRLCRADRPVTLGSADGPTLSAALWSVDDVGDRLHLQPGDGASAAAQAVLRDPQPWAAAYLDDAKLQFALPQLQRNAPGSATWSAPLPQTMYLLPRREAVRVRRSDGPAASVVRVSDRRRPGSPVVLRLLDVSEGGCAVEIPAGVAPPPQGAVLRQVEIELDEATILCCDLVVQHRRVPSAGRAGRMGCRWSGLAPAASERLRRWIRSGQRRRELISLTLD